MNQRLQVVIFIFCICQSLSISGCLGSHGLKKSSNHNFVPPIGTYLSGLAEKAERILETSVLINISNSLDHTLSITTRQEEEEKDLQKLKKPNNMSTYDYIESRIKELIDQGKMNELYSVVVYAQETVKYGEVFEVMSEYETALYSVLHKDREVIFRFSTLYGTPMP